MIIIIYRCRKWLLDAAETVLGFFGFDMAVYVVAKISSSYPNTTYTFGMSSVYFSKMEIK